MALLRICLLAAGLFCAMPVLANDSVYTKLVLEDCTIVDDYNEEEGGDSIAFVCHGQDDIPVYVAEGDLRFTVSPLPKGYRGPVQFETLPPFNSLGETLEWRRDDAGNTVATILRWFTDGGDGRKGETLVVTRVAADGVCHVAEIDALANKEANAMARDIADGQAAAFRCGQDEVMRR